MKYSVTNDFYYVCNYYSCIAVFVYVLLVFMLTSLYVLSTDANFFFGRLSHPPILRLVMIDKNLEIPLPYSYYSIKKTTMHACPLSIISTVLIFYDNFDEPQYYWKITVSVCLKIYYLTRFDYYIFVIL